jgi:hypothetical protein
MSVETLILVALLIVLPLIQQVIRATRERSQHFPAPAERRSPGTVARTPPPELAVPPLPDTKPPVASDAPASALPPARQGGGPLTIALKPQRTMEQQAAVGLRARRDLRRAIVLVAMLGPCRANSPYDWPDQAARP